MGDQLVAAHTPAAGKVIRVNESLLTGDLQVLLQHPERNGFIAMIAPAVPYGAATLLTEKEYQLLPDVNCM